MKNTNLVVIAGPKFISKTNYQTVVEISRVTVENIQGEKKKALSGARIIGFSSSGGNVKITDQEQLHKNINILINGGKVSDLSAHYSVSLAAQASKETKLMAAVEIESAIPQLSTYENQLQSDKLFIYPSQNALSHLHLVQMLEYARKNKWLMALTNPGCMDEKRTTELWLRLWEDLKKPKDVLFLYKVTSEKYKEAIAVKTKTGLPMYADFSDLELESGKLERLVSAAAKVKLNKDAFLFDGLIVNTELTKTKGILDIAQLTSAAREIAKTRDLVTPAL